MRRNDGGAVAPGDLEETRTRSGTRPAHVASGDDDATLVDLDAERLAPQRDAACTEYDDDVPTVKRPHPSSPVPIDAEAEMLAEAAAHGRIPTQPCIEVEPRRGRADGAVPTRWAPPGTRGPNFLPPPVVRRAFVQALGTTPPPPARSRWGIVLLVFLAALVFAAGAFVKARGGIR
jgi:hypothetical protein